ncbi:MAG: hypothetical protein KGS72_12975 [Cyanobacteria bacterium REEB67]|nr:hypothetical protein [Cyanobacteria bacterium REEB67]
MDLKDAASADELRLAILQSLQELKNGEPEPGALDTMLCKSLDVTEGDLKTVLKWLRNRKLVGVVGERNVITDAGAAYLAEHQSAAKV